MSPILGLPNDKPNECSWTQQLEKVFTCIERNFRIVDMSWTGTHIHVSPVDGLWTQAQIVSIGEGVNLVSGIIPLLPRWANTERTAKFAMKNPQGVFNNTSTIRSVVRSLCPTRDVAWNLRPIFDEPDKPAKGTIEFRRLPQSRSAGEAKLCITITLCLVVLSFKKNELAETIGTDGSIRDQKFKLLVKLTTKDDRKRGRFQ